MEEEARKVLERELHDLAAVFRGVLEWKWDSRFGTVLAEFPVDKKAGVLGQLERRLVSSWDSATIVDAPETARQVAKHLGGLLSGQLLLLSGPAEETLVYCAWWPWGNGQTISIRVGLHRETSDGEGSGPPEEILKEAFALS